MGKVPRTVFNEKQILMHADHAALQRQLVPVFALKHVLGADLNADQKI